MPLGLEWELTAVVSHQTGHGGWELSSSPLQEQSELLTLESSLQPWDVDFRVAKIFLRILDPALSCSHKKGCNPQGLQGLQGQQPIRAT